MTIVWWQMFVGIFGALLFVWFGLALTLWITRPDSERIREALRLLPDLVRLLSRLARDKSVPRSARILLWAVVAYLAMPIDVIPDFIPVIGYADDAIIVSLILRAVVRRAGPEAIERNWPGSPDGLATIRRLANLSTDTP